MRADDTNILARLATRDDAKQVAAAEAFVAKLPSIMVPRCWAVGFSDWLVLEVARKAGHLPLGTFDRELGRLDGAQKL